MSINTVTVTSTLRPVAIQALSALIDDKAAEDLHESAIELLQELQRTNGDTTTTRVDLATVKAEALATALDDLLKTDQLSESDATRVDNLLNLF